MRDGQAEDRILVELSRSDLFLLFESMRSELAKFGRTVDRGEQLLALVDTMNGFAAMVRAAVTNPGAPVTKEFPAGRAEITALPTGYRLDLPWHLYYLITAGAGDFLERYPDENALGLTHDEVEAFQESLTEVIRAGRYSAQRTNPPG